ncbi:MAG: hypothetical protein MJ153_03770 [Clostridia bacterium]|nr:hypothetical protein [Clostridia bacterium]
MFTRISDKKINKLGRCIVQKDYSEFFWTGSGIEFITDTANIILDVEAEYAGLDIWLTVEVNGALVQRVMLLPGKNRIGILHSMEEGKDKRVRILKETQLDVDAPHYVRFLGLTDFEGNEISLKEPPHYDMQIDFYGDSLTTGEGLYGKEGEMDFAAVYMGFRNGYARITSDVLNANYRVCSQSGWGVKSGFDNCILKTIPSIYKYTDGKSIQYDFASNQADFVVINLGTNDWGAFNSEAWISPEGKMYKLRLDENKKAYPEDAEKFIEAAVAFLNELQVKYRDSKFVWMIGMCPNGIHEYIRTAISRCSEPERVRFLEVESSVDYGSREHPGPIGHRDAADKLIQCIKSF